MDMTHYIAHQEINEDGRVTQHPGYLNVTCKKCSTVFLIARNLFEKFTTCSKCSAHEGGLSEERVI
jgi:hypothetical protein